MCSPATNCSLESGWLMERLALELNTKVDQLTLKVLQDVNLPNSQQLNQTYALLSRNSITGCSSSKMGQMSVLAGSILAPASSPPFKPSRWCGVEVWRGGASSGVVLVI
ncbi:hypothetical protein AVEN_82241-1 [Araneus ventricosus]|uniref:Uncharacterized protein n=1 Tax=Araneus ventricosus TaxID=182803 RepID=A0A4Y2I080_ARAVE|nr:hypothetical protein AVEN_82241-1 [Araneus ventricosus]